jgi:hypothetical protein
MAEEMLIGFDAREPVERLVDWDESRRRRFLLRDDVARPLSVDVDVWPRARELAAQLTRGYDRSAVGPNAPLWESLDRMKSRLAEQGADLADVPLVSLGWLSRHAFRDTDNMGGYYGVRPDPVPTEPPRPEQSWTLLGYDVADLPFSGLSNCSYKPEERERLREEWAPELNEHHLFGDPEAVFAFLELTNVRVPDHAPFHVYSLYRLP